MYLWKKNSDAQKDEQKFEIFGHEIQEDLKKKFKKEYIIHYL